jgi:hypothetical protein
MGSGWLCQVLDVRIGVLQMQGSVSQANSSQKLKKCCANGRYTMVSCTKWECVCAACVEWVVDHTTTRGRRMAKAVPAQKSNKRHRRSVRQVREVL